MKEFPLAAQRLSKAIEFKTISCKQESDTSFFSAFRALHRFFDESYPLISKKLLKVKFGEFSLLYKWEGKNKELPPIVLMAHQDVVPVSEIEISQWKFPPFSGKITQDTIWGRGTLDDKVGLMCILEAGEALLAEGFAPDRTIYFAFGHDEEIGGKRGAKKIAEYLETRGDHAYFILDEGLTITQGLVPKIDSPVALIGTTEKGYMTVELAVNHTGGHSSMPAKHTAIDILAENIARLKRKTFTAVFTKPVDAFLDYIGPEMPYPEKVVFANRWLFDPVIKNIYSQSNAGNALIRTTTAPTIFQSGVKDNVLPHSARAVVNFRLLPGTSQADVRQHLHSVLDTAQVSIKVVEFSESPPLSSITSESFQYISKTIQKVYSNVLIAPSLLIAGTDSKHYRKISDNIYRFLPVFLTPKNISQIHGVNERIATKDLIYAANFYYELIRNI
ncbi:MAG: M20 family peptidase [Cytophagales bacterium]|nr:M20 family peptidase [Cytophagales bacterium]